MCGIIGAIALGVLSRTEGPRPEPPRDTLAYYKDIRVRVKAALYDVFTTDEAGKDEEVIRLLMIPVTILNLRPCDLTMNQRSRMLNVTAEQRYLRVDGGTLRMYNTTLGSWDSFAGVVSEAILSCIQKILLHVEGFLGDLAGDVPRTETGVLAAFQLRFRVWRRLPCVRRSCSSSERIVLATSLITCSAACQKAAKAGRWARR